MGLDSVELILAVEEGFQIHIADEEAQEALTVGDLYDLVLSKLDCRDSRRCLTSAAFYRTRRGIVEALGLQRTDVRPSTQLEAILPKATRNAKWQRIQESMKLDLPCLHHTTSSCFGLTAICVALTVGSGLYLQSGLVGLGLLLLLGLVAGAFLVHFTPELAVQFPSSDATVGDLAKGVLAANHRHFMAEIGTRSRNNVWEVLCAIIENQLGVERAKLTPDARFVVDLGVD